MNGRIISDPIQLSFDWKKLRQARQSAVLEASVPRPLRIEAECAPRQIGQHVPALTCKLGIPSLRDMAARTFQRTIRRIPKSLDEALRARAKQSGISLNQAAVAALARGIGLSDEPFRHHDLDNLAGTWKEDPAFEQAVADQDTIDPSL